MSQPSRCLTPGPEIAAARRLAGLSLATVAARLGVSKTRIVNIETAACTTPAAAGRVLRAIAELAAEAESES